MSWTTPHNEDSKEMKFIEVVRDCYLYQHLEKPTRKRGNNEPSLLDLLLTDEVMQVSDIVYHAPLGKGDHNVISFNLNCYLDYSKPKERYVYEKADFDAMRNNLVETKSIISSLNVSKSSGPNSIPTHILHLLKEETCKPLNKIFNLSFSTGQYPNILKISKTIPIFKKGSRLLVSNYRPISLLSNLNKILEKIVHERIYKFLEDYQCIYSLQFGFRKKHSTNHALIDITRPSDRLLTIRNLLVVFLSTFKKLLIPSTMTF